MSSFLWAKINFVTKNATVTRFEHNQCQIRGENLDKVDIMQLSHTIPFAILLGLSIGTVNYFTSAQSSTPISQQNKQITNKQTRKSEASLTGGLYVQTEDNQQQIFPLKHTEVKAKVSGNLSRVEVTQTFENPFTNPLEAIYVFPLPDEAAVDDMEIKIGDRIIKGNIKKREEAEQIYQEAKQQGRTAGLLTQERANIFTQALANIKPGEQIEVTIRYTDSLKFEAGDYEFVFPMVVGPRYIPGQPLDNSGDTDQVPDASRITPPVLPPGTRSGHDINVTVEIDTGVAISKLRSPSHKITNNREGNIVTVTLDQEDTIPNKDLILRYQVAGKNTQATILSQKDSRGGHFALYLIPALEYKTREIVPKDIIFLNDTSGSQRGEPIEKSKELMRRFLNGLNPDDTFNIIDFANTTQQLSSKPLNNTRENRAKALAYVEQLQGNGGTELLNGIRTVLQFPPAARGRLRSVVLMTDGYIGNENQVIAEVQKQLKPGNRLYTFGVGSSVNRFLVNRLAEVGRGTAQVVRQDEPTQEAAEKFFVQINNPVLTDIKVTWEGGGKAPEIYPLAPPDLFNNQPLVLFGRKEDRRDGIVRITGIAAGGKRYQERLKVNFDAEGNTAIAQLWGRARIKDLMNQMYGGETVSGVEEVTNTALAYRLLSQYTAFVAVSEEVRVNPDGTSQTVQVPVELPEGVSYQGIFGDRNEQGQAMRSNAAQFSAPASMGLGRSRMSGASSPAAPSAPSLRETDNADMAAPPMRKPETAKPPAEAKIALRIQLLNPEVFTSEVLTSFRQHLQTINVPAGISGDVIFELRLSNGRVNLVLLDEKASTLQEKDAIQIIRRQLLTWRPSQNLSGTYQVKLRINP